MNPRSFGSSSTKPNTLRHNQPASVASLRQLFAFTGTPFGLPLELPFTFTGIPSALPFRFLLDAPPCPLRALEYAAP